MYYRNFDADRAHFSSGLQIEKEGAMDVRGVADFHDSVTVMASATTNIQGPLTASRVSALSLVVRKLDGIASGFANFQSDVFVGGDVFLRGGLAALVQSSTTIAADRMVTFRGDFEDSGVIDIADNAAAGVWWSEYAGNRAHDLPLVIVNGSRDFDGVYLVDVRSEENGGYAATGRCRLVTWSLNGSGDGIIDWRLYIPFLKTIDWGRGLTFAAFEIRQSVTIQMVRLHHHLYSPHHPNIEEAPVMATGSTSANFADYFDDTSTLLRTAYTDVSGRAQVIDDDASQEAVDIVRSLVIVSAPYTTLRLASSINLAPIGKTIRVVNDIQGDHGDGDTIAVSTGPQAASRTVCTIAKGSSVDLIRVGDQTWHVVVHNTAPQS